MRVIINLKLKFDLVGEQPTTNLKYIRYEAFPQ